MSTFYQRANIFYKCCKQFPIKEGVGAVILKDFPPSTLVQLSSQNNHRAYRIFANSISIFIQGSLSQGGLFFPALPLAHGWGSQNCKETHRHPIGGEGPSIHIVFTLGWGNPGIFMSWKQRNCSAVAGLWECNVVIIWVVCWGAGCTIWGTRHGWWAQPNPCTQQTVRAQEKCYIDRDSQADLFVADCNKNMSPTYFLNKSQCSLLCLLLFSSKFVCTSMSFLSHDSL